MVSRSVKQITIKSRPGGGEEATYASSMRMDFLPREGHAGAGMLKDREGHCGWSSVSKEESASHEIREE